MEDKRYIKKDENEVKTPEKLYTFEYLMLNLLNFFVLTGNALYVLYPLRLEQMGKNEAGIGMIMGVFSVAALIMRFVAGPLIDKIGRLFFIRVGIIIMLACAVLFAVPIESDSYLILIRFLQGIGLSCYFTSVFTVAADYAPKGRMAEALGIFGISGLVTAASASFIGERILAHFENNFLYLFIGVVVLMLLGMFFSFFVREYHRPSKKADSSPSFLSLLLRFDVLAVVVIGMSFGIGANGVYTFAAPYIKRFDLGTATVFFAAYSGASVLLRILTGRKADKWGRLAILIPGFIVMIMGQSLMQHINSTWFLVAVGFLLGSAHGLVYPSMNALMMDRVGSENRGKGTGIFNAAVDVGYILGAALLGRLAGVVGFRNIYNVAAVIIAVGLVSFLVSEKIIKTNGNKTAISET